MLSICLVSEGAQLSVHLYTKGHLRLLRLRSLTPTVHPPVAELSWVKHEKKLGRLCGLKYFPSFVLFPFQ